MADPLHYQINLALTGYSRFVAEAVDKTAEAAMRRFKKRSIEDAPIGRRLTKRKSDAGRPHFFQSIASTKTVGTMAASVFVWYVKAPNYRLTHLLEDPHKTKNGRTIPGSHFLKRILDEEQPRFEVELMEAIKNGG